MKGMTVAIAAASAAAGALAGAFVGYRLAVRKLTQQYAEAMDEELERTREHYERRGVMMNDKNEFESPEEAAAVLLTKTSKTLDFPDEVPTETLEKVLTGLRYHTPPTITKNIFTNGVEDDGRSFQDEVDARTPEAPYIITHIEHLQSDLGYVPCTVTYYEGDDILADEREDVIENHDEIVGKHNLRFGYRSHDPNVVYIRNDRLRIDYEVLRSTGKYAEEVAGFQKE